MADDGASDGVTEHDAEAARGRVAARAVTAGKSAAGQQTAQHEIVSAIQTVLDARRQRIIVSLAEVDCVKWTCLYCRQRVRCLSWPWCIVTTVDASLIALGLFATGVAASVLLIAAHDRPFVGQLAVKPDLLEQIIPGK